MTGMKSKTHALVGRFATRRLFSRSYRYRYSAHMRPASLIRLSRRNAGLTQRDLGTRAGTSQAAVARYEAGLASPSVATLERLLRAAGTSLVLETRPAPPSNLSEGRAAKLRRHRMDILSRAKASGAVDVRIFGSVARGEDDADSDIDLLVDFEPSESEGLRPIIRLKVELEALLEERVDIVPEGLLAPAAAEAARREAVPL